ncbi:hypothetical protein LTR53_013551 [Teratosphaeriaceae sp. CCFEE 6253]|nr:hypothetical protein LTR53_013551 [Teratosphaeriaceae sp. CCFEE 6253]
MAEAIPDRRLWLAFAAFFAAATIGIRYALADLQSLAPPPLPAEPVDPTPSKPEDSIPLPTLRTLIASPNLHIANAATQILIHRFAALPSARQELRADYHSPDEAVRGRCRAAMEFLMDWHTASPALDRCIRAIAQSTGPWGPENDVRDAELEREARVDRGAGSGSEDSHVARMFSGWADIPRERAEGEDLVGEWERRRWRREAMVVGVGEEDDGEDVEQAEESYGTGYPDPYVPGVSGW